MRWEDERYVRLYTRDTPDWTMMSWEARATMALLLRAVDRAGIINIGKHGLKGLASLLRMPEEVVERATAELAHDGCIVVRRDVLIIRNFIEAQEANQSDAARKRTERERERDKNNAAQLGVLPDREPAHEMSHAVTAGHTPSQAVTPSLAMPSEPNQMLAVSSACAREADLGGHPADPGTLSAGPCTAFHGSAGARANENASTGQMRGSTGQVQGASPPEHRAAAAHDTGPDLLTMAGFLAEQQCQYGQDMLNRAAAQKTLTKPQREKIRELYAEYRERADLAAKAKGIAAAPTDTLQAWASQRWVAARKKRGLGAQEPDQRHIGEICRLATAAVAKAAQDTAEQCNEAWVPEAQEVVAFWIRLYLAEVQTRAGGVSDEGYPLAWLPGKCREYLLPKRSDVRRGEVAGSASGPETRASPVATGRVDEDAPGHTTIPPDMCQRVAQLGANSDGVLRRRSINL